MVEAKAPKIKKSGSNGTNGNGKAVVEDDRVMTVTFRIPTSLKKSVERTANERGMTTTRFVVEALTNEVHDKPPRWWSNYMMSRDREPRRPQKKQ